MRYLIQFTEEDIRKAVAEDAAKRTGRKVDPAMVMLKLRYEGQYDNQQAFIDGAEIELPFE